MQDINWCDIELTTEKSKLCVEQKLYPPKEQEFTNKENEGAEDQRMKGAS